MLMMGRKFLTSYYVDQGQVLIDQSFAPPQIETVSKIHKNQLRAEIELNATTHRQFIFQDYG